MKPFPPIKRSFFLVCLFLFGYNTIFLTASAQEFTRSVLTAGLSDPWEMLYGPDNMLWITQSDGRVSRVDPTTGVVTTIYTAPDYFPGSPLQDKAFPCYTYPIRFGTFGLALHPDFPTTPYVYFIYSFNAGTAESPNSKYKIRRLTWDPVNKVVSNPTDIVTDLPLGYGHDGMRIIIIKQSGIPYIYVTTGDGALDDDNCYPDYNTNLEAQDWNILFGKTLRYTIDGTIPASNPIAGSPVFTKGHRNALGIAYNPATDILYESENGKSTDDEINIILKGKNYGWPKARGYHNDNNYPGEAQFVAGYTPSNVPGDALKEALYSWCTSVVTLPEDPQNVSVTCTVAPSDMIYYPSSGSIEEFKNSLLITTLKNYNPAFRACIYAFKLNAAGTGLDNSGTNPKVYFEVPDPPTLRYRDITTSPDGKTIFICTNNGQNNDLIIKFSYCENVYYRDADGDGYGNPAISIKACTQPAGYVLQSGDCDDTNKLIYPNAPEVCDNVDNNCDGQVDENCSSLPFIVINDASAYESEGKITFTVHLSKRSTSAIDVNYATKDGTATSTSKGKNAPPPDYIAANSVVSIPAGSQSVPINITINNDNVAEPTPETFTVNLSLNKQNSKKVTISDGIGVGTIIDGVAPASTAQIIGSIPKAQPIIEEQTLSVKALLNPSSTSFVLQLQSSQNQLVTIRVFNALGGLVEVRNNIAANTTVQLGDQYPPGFYFGEVQQGKNKVTVKLIKQ